MVYCETAACAVIIICKQTVTRKCQSTSEPALREALIDRYPRDSYILTTKLSNEFMRTREEQEQVFEDQLKRLGVDYFDYYLLRYCRPAG